MKKLITFIVFLLATSFYATASEGLIKHQSPYSVKETADRIESILKDKGLTLFARIDHSENARGVNLSLRPTEVIIFGNPKVGTVLMQCAQEVAIDLPQKMMISEDNNKQVWLSYNSPVFLQKRHKIEGCEEVVNKIAGVLTTIAKDAVAKK